jgi:hypothetical protein
MDFIDDTPLDISMNNSNNADNDADDSQSDLAIPRTDALADNEIIVPSNEILLAFVISN